MGTGLVVLTALLAACSFAVAAVLQQAAAATVPDKDSLRPRLLLDLARRPLWLAGIGMAAFSYVIQGTALAFGPLVLVQPLAATDLIFALPLVARRRGMRLTTLEATGALATAGGVAAFLIVLPEPGGTDHPAPAAWIWLGFGAGAMVAVLVAAGVRARRHLRTGLYAAAAGLLFALLDSVSKSAATLVRAHGTGVMAHWQPYALLVVGGTGLLLAQSSFQAGSLAVSLPIIDTLEPIGSVLIGVVVFRERLAASTGDLVVQALGAAIAVIGILILDRSPLVRSPLVRT